MTRVEVLTMKAFDSQASINAPNRLTTYWINNVPREYGELKNFVAPEPQPQPAQSDDNQTNIYDRGRTLKSALYWGPKEKVVQASAPTQAASGPTEAQPLLQIFQLMKSAVKPNHARAKVLPV
ncbi:MAG TPA: hypothetical protein V6C97_20320 [Oculatellaceae cyanobacterium]